MARYLDAIAWIAQNDNPGDESTEEDLSKTISVLLVADLWRENPKMVAREVLAYRKKRVTK